MDDVKKLAISCRRTAKVGCSAEPHLVHRSQSSSPKQCPILCTVQNPYASHTERRQDPRLVLVQSSGENAVGDLEPCSHCVPLLIIDAWHQAQPLRKHSGTRSDTTTERREPLMSQAHQGHC